MPGNEQIFKVFQNRAWALTPAKLEELAAFLDQRRAGIKIDFPEAAVGQGGFGEIYFDQIGRAHV